MKLITKNKRAYHDYSFDKEYEVGIVLRWHEVKSIKGSHVNIQDSFVRIEEKGMRIIGMDVPLYEKTSHALVPGYQPKGRRKLLITMKEMGKISAMLSKPGTTIIPLEVFISKTWLIKLKIWIGKLMKKVEKKQILKERDVKKQMDREIKHL